MTPVTAAEMPTGRRSSRIRQQAKSAAKPTASTSTSSSTKRRNPKTPKRKTPSSKDTTPMPATFFFLLKLPREIRDMIYTLLISTGQLSILRTCREINLEAQSTFYRAAICRQIAGHYSRGQLFKRAPSELLVQNFELRCNLHSGNDWPRHRAIQTARSDPSKRFMEASFFGRGDVRRNRMVLELGFRRKTSFSDAEYSLEKLLDQPERFIGFRLLVVKFLPMPRGWSIDEETGIRQAVRDILEPKLGSALYSEGEEDGGGCIEFRPWSLVGSQRHRLEPVWFLKPSVWGSERQECFG